MLEKDNKSKFPAVLPKNKNIEELQHKPIDVEKEFTHFIRQIGGSLISEMLPTKNPKFKNADFIFEKEKIIAELKIMKVPVDEKKLNKLIKSSDIQEDELLKKISKILKDPFRKIIADANKQLKETKRELKLDDYKGLLLLCNDGRYNIPTFAILNICMQLLSNSYSSCDGFVYFTVNKYSNCSNDYANLLWIPAYGNNAGNLHIFVDELGRKWWDCVDKLIGDFKFKQEVPFSKDAIFSRYIT